MNVVLIGYRGTGKTTVARLLALRLGWDWVDADVEVELRVGKSIAAIFADDGEPVFRDHEAAVLAELLPRERIVIAAGGGVVIRCDNRALLKQNPHVVWLTASPETLHERITADFATSARRPNLTVGGGLGEVRDLLAKREPWYRECAKFTVDAEKQSPTQVADELIAAFNLTLQRKTT